jgi:hypothetical protein
VQTAEALQAAVKMPGGTPFQPFPVDKMTDQYLNLYQSLLYS